MKAFADQRKAKPVFRRHASATRVDQAGRPRTAQRVRVREILDSSRPQFKLTIGKPNDVYEREADRVADEVMRMPEPQLTRQETVGTQAEDDREASDIPGETIGANGEKVPLNSLSTAARMMAEGASMGRYTCVRRVLGRREGSRRGQAAVPGPRLQGAGSNQRALRLLGEVLRSPGEPLDSRSATFMQDRFRRDLSGVRIHRDGEAARSARALDALGYTVGQHIVFGDGAYRPTTPYGRRLLAHKVAHTVQQRGVGPGSPTNLPVSRPGDPVEREAERASAAALRGEPAVIVGHQQVGVSRKRAPSWGVSFDGCDKAPYSRSVVSTAARTAFNRVLKSNCVKGPKLRKEILKRFDGLTIECEQKGSGCGMAWPIFSNTINVHPASLNRSQCGPLASTILHEVLHLWSPWRSLSEVFNNKTIMEACEKACFNFGPGDPNKCDDPPKGRCTPKYMGYGGYLGSDCIVRPGPGPKI